MSLNRRTLLAAPLLLPGLARAQTGYPDKPVKIIVPFPPGQAADILTRVVADLLSQRWPQRVVVENRGGGAGAPALEAAARAPADGYTLVAGTSGTLGVNPSVLPNIPYDAERDFADFHRTHRQTVIGGGAGVGRRRLDDVEAVHHVGRLVDLPALGKSTDVDAGILLRTEEIGIERRDSLGFGELEIWRDRPAKGGRGTSHMNVGIDGLVDVNTGRRELLLQLRQQTST